MKTYIINLERSKERRKHITSEVERLGLDYEIITAIDGNDFTDEDLAKVADMSVIEPNKHWFGKNLVAGSLSHRKVYETMIRQGDEIALVLEDDARLDPSLKEVLNAVAPLVGDYELTMLYWECLKDLNLSTLGAVEVTHNRKLYYPMSEEGVCSGAAYIVRRSLAKRLYQANFPVRIPPDGWADFYREGAISRIRMIYPAAAGVIGAKSNITVGSRTRFTGWLSSVADELDIPLLNSFFRKRRLKAVEKRLEVGFTDHPSPLYVMDDQAITR
ncbi:MAG: glycosyltransferase family 25 protein [Pyrinomonadaceae bacterium]